MAQRSAFEGRRPTLTTVEDNQNTQSTTSPGATEERGAAEEATRPREEQPASGPQKKPDKKGKVTFYLWAEDRDRAKAAYMHTMGHTNIQSWTQFLETAVREFTHKLEEEHNDRRPFAQPE